MSDPAATSQHLFAHGRLAYVQIPARDVEKSATFYRELFGWQVRGGSKDHLSFRDSTGDIIGAFVTGRSTADDPGVLIYIYVHGIDAVIERITASGGTLVRPPYPEGSLWVATVTDPAGNIIGVWQQGPR